MRCSKKELQKALNEEKSVLNFRPSWMQARGTQPNQTNGGN